MYSVYVLKSDQGKYYKGVTSNLDRRLKEHLSGNTRTTALMNCFEVVYLEEYQTFKEARTREVYLKTAAGRRFLQKKLNNMGH